jgi:hypothetical protein
MALPRARLLAVAAALTAIAIAGPVASAGAATDPPATVVGPTYVTSGGASFTNTNTQVSLGDSSSGGQVAP